jgi:hypothetical protein
MALLLVCLGCAACRTEGKHADIAYHLEQRKQVLRDLENVGPDSPKQSTLIRSFEQHQRRLVELGHFQHLYAEIPRESLKPEMSASNHLLQRFHRDEDASIDDAWFEVLPSLDDAVVVEIWGADEQIEILKSILRECLQEGDVEWRPLGPDPKISQMVTDQQP